MSDPKLAILALFGVGLASVSAYMHVNGSDGSGWGFAAFIIWFFIGCKKKLLKSLHKWHNRAARL